MKPSSGYTLIEMLVAMAISSVLLAGTVQLFVANRKAFKLVDQLKLVEENGRIGMDLLARDVRGASTGEGGRPIYIWDNDDANNNPAQTEGAIDRSALDTLPGTDVLEVFVSLCSEPFIITGFNENSASAPQLPMDLVASCLPCYNPGDGGGVLSSCASQFNIRLNKIGSSYSCQHNITNGNEQGGNRINLNWNNGQNIDNANRPHQCNDGIGGLPTWDAEANIGMDIYYYVRADDPDNPNPATPNPQLMRYQVGLSPEVVANHVEDFQALVGEDSSNPFDGTIDTWASGVTDGTDVTAVKLSLMLKTPKIDPGKEQTMLTQLENSAIVGIGAQDQYRRRIITRVVRLRNMSN